LKTIRSDSAFRIGAWTDSIVIQAGSFWSRTVQEQDWHEGAAVILGCVLGALALLAVLGWLGWYLFLLANPD
jgi:hypothetical protein